MADETNEASSTEAKGEAKAESSSTSESKSEATPETKHEVEKALDWDKPKDAQPQERSDSSYDIREPAGAVDDKDAKGRADWKEYEASKKENEADWSEYLAKRKDQDSG